jgi:hypothetical protein
MPKQHDLIEAWRRCNLEAPPHVFPGDEELLSDFAIIHQSFDEYVNSPQFGAPDKRFHTGLLPLPFAGNLERASIFILMLNPGLSAGDYFAEERVLAFRQAHIRMLRQENAADEFPFIFLNPAFAWHPGAMYWQKKFHSIVKAIQQRRRTSYQQAMRILSGNLACLELVPYHSKSFGAGSLLEKLPSVQMMRKFVQDVLIPKARADQAVVIVTRQASMWQLPAHRNIVIYQGGETRAAHLTMSSRGGQAIAERLGLKPKGE